MPCSRVARKPISFEHVHNALLDIDEGRGGRPGNTEMRNETAGCTTVRNGYGVARKILIPLAHACRYRLVALPAGRHKMPLVMLAGGDALGIARMQLRDRESFPFAERNFRKPHLQAVATRRQPEWRAHPFPCFAGACKRAGHIIEIGGVAAAARE